MSKFYVLLLLLAPLSAHAGIDKDIMAMVKGDYLNGMYNCEVKDTLSSNIVNLKLVLNGTENRYDAHFYDGKKTVVVGEGLFDSEFPNKLVLNYIHKIEGHSGKMTLNFSDEKKQIGGNWYSFASFKLGSLSCLKTKK